MKVITTNKIFECDTATTNLQIAKGLMFKREFNPLLFIFPKEVHIPFHTLCMLKTIDLIFINSDKIVVDKFTVKPFKYYIKSIAPFKYALEVKASEGKDINIGDRVYIK